MRKLPWYSERCAGRKGGAKFGSKGSSIPTQNDVCRKYSITVATFHLSHKKKVDGRRLGLGKFSNNATAWCNGVVAVEHTRLAFPDETRYVRGACRKHHPLAGRHPGGSSADEPLGCTPDDAT